MRIILIFFLLIGALEGASAQLLKWKKVDKKNLEMSSCPYEKDAVAEFLQRSVKMELGINKTKGIWEVTYQYHHRVKIYKEEGFEYANWEIDYFDLGYRKETVTALDVYVYNLVGGKEEKIKLSHSEIYKNKINEQRAELSFACPGVRKGSIIDIRYTLTSPYFRHIPIFYMQQDIPVRYAHFETKIPKGFNYNYISSGFVDLNLEEERVNEVFDVATNESIPMFRREGTVPIEMSIKRFTAKDVPSIREEPFVYTMKNYMSAMKMELLNIREHNGLVKNMTTSWDEIAKQLMDSESFGKQLLKDYDKAKIISNKHRDLEPFQRMREIYYEVQRMSNHDGYIGVYTGDGIKEYLKDGNGSVSEINLFLCNALRTAGINAFPLISKTNNSGLINYGIPSISDLDYTTTVAFINEQSYYLDASDPYLDIDMVSPRVLNLSGIVISESGSSEFSLLTQNKGKETYLLDLSLDGVNLSGEMDHMATGYSAYLLNGLGEAGYSGMNSESFDNFVLNSYEDSKDKLKINSSIEIRNKVTEIDERLIIEAYLEREDYKSPFVSEERKFSLFFESIHDETYIIKIQIPEGYEVESLPEPLNITTPDNVMRYNYSSKVVGDNITVIIKEVNEQRVIPAAYYPSIKNLYELIEEKLKEKIVLKKI